MDRANLYRRRNHLVALKVEAERRLIAQLTQLRRLNFDIDENSSVIRAAVRSLAEVDRELKARRE